MSAISSSRYAVELESLSRPTCCDTHATELQRHKVPLEIISKRLLHRQLATTSDQYVHLSADDMRTALEGSGFWQQEEPQ